MSIKQKIATLFVNKLVLIPSGIGIKNFKLIRFSIFDNVSSNHFYKYALYKYFFQKTKKATFNNTPYIIHNHWSAGYHHWITESLVRLIHVKEYQTKLLLIPDNYPTFAFDSLKILGVKNIQKISSTINLKLTSLEIPENPNSGFYFKDHLIQLKSLLIQKAIPINKPYIYITRKNAKKRKIENENEIIPLLQQYNFEIIDADSLSITDQINLFISCKVLISIHGAALTNCIFMNENTHLIELYKSNTFINHCYERMAKQLNIKFTRLLCEGGSNSSSHVDITNLIVNTNSLKQTLNQLN